MEKLQRKVQDNFKVSFVSRDGAAVVVDVVELVGVKCPHFACRMIIDDIKIKKLVDEVIYYFLLSRKVGFKV